jgi:Rrf2 family iron-sulfur cluster assembly transcriptional regulator
MRLELTRRSEYAIRACMRLAFDDGLLSGRQIAAATDVPERFLARVLGELVRAGVIEAELGRTGGYRLRRRPADLTLLELVESIEGPSRSTRCVLRQRACDPGHPCAIHPVWAAAQDGVIGVLEATTLADLVARETAIDPAGARALVHERPLIHERTA